MSVFIYFPRCTWSGQKTRGSS